MAKKKITLEDLALITKQGFAESKNTIINAIDELALITKRGFDAVDERFDNLEKSNTREHEEMSLKLDDVAYRFELVALTHRVEKIEKIVGAKSIRQTKAV